MTATSATAGGRTLHGMHRLAQRDHEANAARALDPMTTKERRAPGRFQVLIPESDGALRRVLLHAITAFEYSSDTQSWWATLAMDLAGFAATQQLHIQFSEFDGTAIVAERWERGHASVRMRSVVEAVATKLDTADGHEELLAALAASADDAMAKLRPEEQPRPFLTDRVMASQRAAVVTRLLHDQAPKAALDTALAMLATGPYDGPVDDILTATTAALAS